jgi:hypothetical protein
MASVPSLKRSNPEAEGISSSAVLEFVRPVEQHVRSMDAVRGFMLLRHGNVAAEGGGLHMALNALIRSSH